jgi:phosphoglycerate-specific signal transduction histidine kinase
MTAMSPITLAKDRTGRIQQELEVASAELHLTNTALENSLPTATKKGDVARALAQNAALEVKVSDAADDLQEVAELLHKEVEQRKRLEGELAAAQRAQ